jgi:hypothetical protein
MYHKSEVIPLVIIKNSNDQVFCHPGTDKPFMFDSFEKAEDLIDRMGLSGAFAVEVDDSGEEAVERYGGQEDLW